MKPDPDELVMYLVARSDLGMSAGKLGAQCGHGVQLCIREAERTEAGAMALAEWESKDYTKVTLEADERQMGRLLRSLSEAGIPHARVVDLGRTEIAENTLTLVAVGPVRRREAAGHVRRLQAYKR